MPDSRAAERVLDDLRKTRAHMAVVLDEYGGTAGIITMEDLIEEVIGDISDEYDFAARTAIEADGVLELDGTMSLIDVRSDHRVQIPEGDWTTLGGYAFAKLGRLPRMGDRVPVPGGELEVIAMDGRRIAALRVHRAATAAPAQPQSKSEQIATAHDPYAALRYRDFRLYMFGRMLGVIGWQMLQVALGWELYERTHSALALGLVGLATALPVSSSHFPAGDLADRMDRKRILVVVAGRVHRSTASRSRPVLLARARSRSCSGDSAERERYRRTTIPRGQAMLPQLVPADVFGNAVTWASSGFQVAAVVGPGIGGIVIALEGGATGTYVISTLLTCVYLWALIEIRGCCHTGGRK